MTDVTNDITGAPSRAPRKSTTVDLGGVAVEAPTSFETSKSFAAKDGSPATPQQLAAEADALLRASLETVRAKAEELRRQTTDWAAVRTDQAREIIDERPLTVVLAAFGMGLIAGMILKR